MTPVQSTQDRRALYRLLGITAVAAMTHVLLSWGYIGRFWLDSGRWLHEVDRFARGEVLYRDFVWPFPPLALWILGGVGSLFGSSVGPIWTATSIVFLLLLFLYSLYVLELVEPSLCLPALLAGTLLATAHANWVSAPLPMGMYTPAAPIGFLFLFAALLCFLRGLGRERADPARRPASACIGVLCGLAILTKQDFWAPAALLAAAAGWRLGLRPKSRDAAGAALVWAPFSITVAAGAGIVALTAGWSRVWDVLDGFGRVAEQSGRPFPSWERITIQLAGAALVGLLGVAALIWGRSLSLREAGKWLGLLGAVFLAGIVLHVWMSFRIGVLISTGAAVAPSYTQIFMQDRTRSTATLLRGALAWTHVRLENNLFPVFLPGGLLLGLLASRSHIRNVGVWRTVVFLVLFCLSARLRRGFEHVEWFHLLLEIPVYLAGASLLLAERRRASRRALQAALAALVLLGLYCHLRWGQDRLVSQHWFQRVDTPRGTIYLMIEEAEQYRLLQEALARLDPDRTRPLLAFGYTGGYNYFLDRPNPTPLEEGFQFSGFPPDKAIDQIKSCSPPAILLDTSYYRDIATPARRLAIAHWELPMDLNVHMRVDRPFFEKALAGCREFERIHLENGLDFMLYDCAPPGS